MGLRCLITEFLWLPSSSIIRLWLPYSTKVLVKTNQTSPNSMELRRLITEFPPSSSIIRLWLPHSTKVLAPSSDSGYHIAPKYSARRIKRAQTRWVASLSSHGHLPAPSSDSGYHIVSKYSSRRIKRAQTRWGCVV
ncbi:hypothetical protein EVAR_75724_1 [Eumeta japonica]|uniref:Uncharacterized protein n=1 Tax=Eumeta variegata TaxID=151549 RepID=A0A4C1W422_EUMVA|nr:hypothetical protein EVAR_75724_1 [Eumeta japonica]